MRRELQAGSNVRASERASAARDGSGRRAAGGNLGPSLLALQPCSPRLCGSGTPATTKGDAQQVHKGGLQVNAAVREQRERHKRAPSADPPHISSRGLALRFIPASPRSLQTRCGARCSRQTRARPPPVACEPALAPSTFDVQLSDRWAARAATQRPAATFESVLRGHRPLHTHPARASTLCDVQEASSARPGPAAEHPRSCPPAAAAAASGRRRHTDGAVPAAGAPSSLLQPWSWTSGLSR